MIRDLWPLVQNSSIVQCSGVESNHQCKYSTEQWVQYTYPTYNSTSTGICLKFQSPAFNTRQPSIYTVLTIDAVTVYLFICMYFYITCDRLVIALFRHSILKSIFPILIVAVQQWVSKKSKPLIRVRVCCNDLVYCNNLYMYTIAQRWLRLLQWRTPPLSYSSRRRKMRSSWSPLKTRWNANASWQKLNRWALSRQNIHFLCYLHVHKMI